jgi:hypothetical protein
MIWALTLALPAKTLISSRPTARLLGLETIMSVVGPIIANFIITLMTVNFLTEQPFYKCNPFDGTDADLRKWWQLADNYVGSVTSICAMYQIINSAWAYNLGTKYRQGGSTNRIFMSIYAFLFAVISCVLLMNPSTLGCAFRINCGTPEALGQLGYEAPWNAPSTYFSDSGHNVIPPHFRMVLFAVCMIQLAVVVLYEKIVILGAGRAWAKGGNPSGKQMKDVNMFQAPLKK